MTELPLQGEGLAVDREGAEVLAADLARLDAGQYRIIAEFLLEHGWTEPLYPALQAEPSPETVERVDGS